MAAEEGDDMGVVRRLEVLEGGTGTAGEGSGGAEDVLDGDGEAGQLACGVGRPVVGREARDERVGFPFEGLLDVGRIRPEAVPSEIASAWANLRLSSESSAGVSGVFFFLSWAMR